LKCNLSYISHRKYVLKAIIICITEEEFGPKRAQETGYWKRSHYEELCDLYYSGYQSKTVHTGFWWGDLKKRDHFEDLFLDGTIILKRTFKK
jgi:hypothetical protein